MILSSLELCTDLVILAAAVSVSINLIAQSDSAQSSPESKTTVDFKRDIKPIFLERCEPCHGPDRQMDGLRLDNRADAMKGADSGPVIKLCDGASSKLIQSVAGEGNAPLMPAGLERLTTDQVSKLRVWIDQGANWPADSVEKDLGAK